MKRHYKARFFKTTDLTQFWSFQVLCYLLWILGNCILFQNPGFILQFNLTFVARLHELLDLGYVILSVCILGCRVICIFLNGFRYRLNYDVEKWRDAWVPGKDKESVDYVDIHSSDWSGFLIGAKGFRRSDPLDYELEELSWNVRTRVKMPSSVETLDQNPIPYYLVKEPAVLQRF